MASPASTDPRNRLQPSLLDRLIDDQRAERSEAEGQRWMSKARLRAAVLRDLGALFNAVQPLVTQADAYPGLAASVLNFGLPPLAGRLASRLDASLLESTIHEAIVRFEPRILPHTLQVRAMEATSLLDSHNVIEFEIRGQLWSEPLPLDILLRTQLDLEAGQVQVRDAAAASARLRKD